MNTPPDDPTAAPAPLPELAAELLEHLGRESAALAQTADALEEMHRALCGADLEGLRAAQGRQEAIADRLEQLRRERGDVLRALGAAVGTAPEAVTVRAVAERLPAELAGPLDAAREQTQRLARDVDSLNRKTAVLAAHCLTFVHGCLADLYGESATAARYSRVGQAVEAPRGALLEVRG